MKLILGTVQFGLNYGINNKTGKPSRERVFEILDYALENGITTLDTAEVYGEAHTILGSYPKINRFRILSKFKLESETDKVSVHLKSAQAELAVNEFESYSFHSASQFLNFKNWEELISLREQGLIKKIGVSIYTNEDLSKAIDHAHIDLIQIPFNILDNRALKNGLLKNAKRAGKIIHVRSIYLQGLLLKPIKEFNNKFEPLIPYILKLSKIAQNNDLTLTELAFLYPHSIDEIDGIVIGVDTLEQLKINLNFSKRMLSTSVQGEIENVICDKSELLNPSLWGAK